MRPEHRAVVAALRSMEHDLLLRCRCWFGGGTEIVLDLDEYRLSRDIGFLCADADGYRELRSLVVAEGIAALFGGRVREERAARADQYGVRGIVSIHDMPLRFEIVREGRIELAGRPDRELGVPRLCAADRIAEKLLANADRCQDAASGFRDAIDLGMLALRRGPFPAAAFAKAEQAYGGDIGRKLAWALDRLAADAAPRRVAEVLGMDAALVEAAVRALAAEHRRHAAAGP